MNPEQLRGLLVGEHSSLRITFNDHTVNYQDARTWWETASDDERGLADWASDEEREKALLLNSVWLIQWYPQTPIGFNAVWASSFEAAAKVALNYGA
jgi:hypothetical protein